MGCILIVSVVVGVDYDTCVPGSHIFRPPIYSFPQPASASNPQKKSNSLGPPCEVSSSANCPSTLISGSLSDAVLSALPPVVCDPLPCDCASGVNAGTVVESRDETPCRLVVRVGALADSDENGGGEKPTTEGERLVVGSATIGEPDLSAEMGKDVDNWGDWRLKLNAGDDIPPEAFPVRDDGSDDGVCGNWPAKYGEPIDRYNSCRSAKRMKGLVPSITA